MSESIQNVDNHSLDSKGNSISNNLIDDILNKIPIAKFSLSPQTGNILDINSAFELITGFKIQDWIGVNFTKIIHPDDFDKALIAFQKAQKGETPPTIDIRILSKSMDYKYIQIDALPVIESGKVNNIIGIARDITNQKIQNFKLKQSEFQFRRLFEDSNDSIIIYQESGEIIDVNRKCIEMFNINKSELLSMNISDFIKSNMITNSTNYTDIFITNNETEFEVHFKTNTGSLITALISSSSLKSGNENIVYLIVRDITSTKKAENKLIEEIEKSTYTSKQLSTVLNTVNEGIVTINSKGEVILANQNMTEIFDYDSSELIGNDLSILMPEKFREAHKDGLSRYLKTREPHVIGQRLELEGMKKNGEIFPLEISITETEINNELFFTAAIRDISVRKEEENRKTLLLEKEIEQRRKIEALQEISMTVTSELDYSTVLKSIAEYTRDISKSKFAFVAVKKEQNIYETVAVAGQDDEYATNIHRSIDIENDLPHECINFKLCILEKKPSLIGDVAKQFKVKYWRDALINRGIKSMTAIPLIYKDQVKGVLALYSEQLGRINENELNLMVSFANYAAIAIENARLYEEIKLNSERLTNLNYQIESINKELKDFAYIVSHDLKAPLRAINSLSIWLLEDYGDKLDSEGKENINLIISRVERMSNLIEGILRYSRIGRLDSQLYEIDTNELIENVIKSIEIPDNIQTKVDKNMPTIYCEPVSMEQVFQNLINNAIKFMDKPQGIIEISSCDLKDYWLFKVSDNGPGIDSSYHDKIFDIFQTLKSRDEIESTGIGLTIVKKIIRNYKGKVWIESEIGKGTTFNFTILKNLGDSN